MLGQTNPAEAWDAKDFVHHFPLMFLDPKAQRKGGKVVGRLIPKVKHLKSIQDSGTSRVPKLVIKGLKFNESDAEATGRSIARPESTGRGPILTSARTRSNSNSRREDDQLSRIRSLLQLTYHSEAQRARQMQHVASAVLPPLSPKGARRVAVAPMKSEVRGREVRTHSTLKPANPKPPSAQRYNSRHNDGLSAWDFGNEDSWQD